MGNRKLINGVAVLVAAGVLAGCGSSKPSAARTVRRTTPTGQHTTTTPTIAALSPCAHSGEIRAGVLDAFRMGAVDFSTLSDGVGLTAGEFSCFRPNGDGGYSMRYEAAPEQLATTQDGGRTWTLVGNPLPAASTQSGRYGEFVVRASADTTWMVSSEGRTFLTSDGGKTWTVAPLPGPVVSLETRDGYLWALACQSKGVSCHPTVLERKLATPGAGGWRKLATLPMSVLTTPLLALLPAGRAVLSVLPNGVPAGRLYIVNAGSSRVESLVEPRWRGRPCHPAELTTSGTQIWLLCLGGAAAGSSTKALLVSSDGGSTWQVRSSVASLTKPPAPTGIPLMEPSALVATTGLKLWMGLQNGLATSGDGGRSWSYARNVNPQGELTFDVVSPTQVFALAPGAGLWRTADGTTWTAVGPLNTG